MITSYLALLCMWIWRSVAVQLSTSSYGMINQATENGTGRYAFLGLMYLPDYVTDAQPAMSQVAAMARQLRQVNATFPYVVLTNRPDDAAHFLSAEKNVRIRNFTGAPLESPCNESLSGYNEIKAGILKGWTMSGWRFAWQKLLAWTLTEYERLLYLDLDMTITKNIDHFFNTRKLSPGGIVAQRGDEICLGPVWDARLPHGRPKDPKLNLCSATDKDIQPRVDRFVKKFYRLANVLDPWPLENSSGLGVNGGAILLQPSMVTFKGLMDFYEEVMKPECPGWVPKSNEQALLARFFSRSSSLSFFSPDEVAFSHCLEAYTSLYKWPAPLPRKNLSIGTKYHIEAERYGVPVVHNAGEKYVRFMRAVQGGVKAISLHACNIGRLRHTFTRKKLAGGLEDTEEDEVSDEDVDATESDPSSEVVDAAEGEP